MRNQKYGSHDPMISDRINIGYAAQPGVDPPLCGHAQKSG
jgi:hypothetical protein